MIIQLSPQVTPTEAPDPGLAQQNHVEEKDNTNAFSKLLQGLLKKIKTASTAENSQEGMIQEKASPLHKLKAEPEKTEGKEGIAALFAPREGLVKTADLSRKTGSLASSGEDGTRVQENKQTQTKELKTDGPKGKASPEKEFAPAMEGEKTGQADFLSGDPGTDNSLNELSLESLEKRAEPGDTPRTGLVDALAADPGKTAVIKEHLFNNSAKPGLVDADKNRETPQEGKVKDKRKERLALETNDQRTQTSQEAKNTSVHNTEETLSTQKADAEIVVELRDGSRPADERGFTKETRNAQSFQDLLSRELRDGLNTEIVRHASLVLKENGEGLIRLSLRPESLGNIKIRLEMADNKVTGRIILESDEALKAFEKEIRSLEQAFKDSGFDSASLEMALSSDHGNDAAGQQWKGEEARPFFSERFAASSYEALVDYEGRPGLTGENDIPLVNVLA